MRNRFLYCMISITFFCGCKQPVKKESLPADNWQSQFEKQLAVSGHRNWVLVVDKAFPEQPGMQVINTGEHLLPVVKKVLSLIDSSTHVKPNIYTDLELQYIDDSLAAGAAEYKNKLQSVLHNLPVQSILHDSVFLKMNAAQKLFSVTVLKTEEVIPYSSVFIELDCKYWNSSKEAKLRDKLKSAKGKID